MYAYNLPPFLYLRTGNGTNLVAGCSHIITGTYHFQRFEQYSFAIDWWNSFRRCAHREHITLTSYRCEYRRYKQNTSNPKQNIKLLAHIYTQINTALPNAQQKCARRNINPLCIKDAVSNDFHMSHQKQYIVQAAILFYSVFINTNI